MGLKQDGRENRDPQAAEEAAIWLQRLRVEGTPEVRAEFFAWVRKGAVNLEEFLFAQALWKEMDHIDQDMRQKLWTGEDQQSIVDFPIHEPLRSDTSRRREMSARPFRRSWLMSAAAMLAMVVIGWATLSLVDLQSDVYATNLGEQTSAKLPDGSFMHLNTDSRAVVSFTDRERVIRLESGEALFSVTHDPQRPFYVLTDRARIRAVGTEFNVRAGDRETRVAVIEGVVQVSSLRGVTSATPPASGKVADVQLRAGDEANVDRTHIVKAQRPNIERAVSWRARRLMFLGDPMAEIAAEFNRYNKTPIRFEGDELARRRMSGVFDADDPSPLLRYLERDPAIEIIRGEDEILIRPKESE